MTLYYSRGMAHLTVDGSIKFKNGEGTLIKDNTTTITGEEIGAKVEEIKKEKEVDNENDT